MTSLTNQINDANKIDISIKKTGGKNKKTYKKSKKNIQEIIKKHTRKQKIIYFRKCAKINTT